MWIVRSAFGCLIVGFLLLVAASHAPAAEEATPTSDAVLAFQRDRAVWAVGPDWVPHRLTMGSLEEWSPDGSRILFSLRDRLRVYELATGRVNVTGWRPSHGQDYVQRTAWSPAGDKIAVLGEAREGYGMRLAVVSPSGGKPVTIAEGFGASSESFDWSPDGRRLAFVSCFLVGPGSHGEGHCQLNALEVRTRRSRVLLRNLSWADIGWSPDGTSIAMQTQLRRAPEEGAFVEGSEGIWILDLATRRFTRLATGIASRPAWRPDSQALAYTTGDEYASDDPRHRPDAIWVVDRTGARKQLAEAEDDEQYGPDLDWSPAGDFIATYAWDSSDGYVGRGLRVIDATTGQVVQRTSADDSLPRWRPP